MINIYIYRNVAITLLMLMFSTQVWATSYYFSNLGNDITNNGTNISSPFKTIDKLNTLTLKPGDFVYFHCNEVFEGQINIKASGLVNSKIKISSYGTGTNPVIKGTIQCTNWQLYQKNIYVSSIPKNFSVGQLFANNKLLTLARFPNKGFLNIDSVSNLNTIIYKTNLTHSVWDSANAIIKTTKWTYENRVISKSTSNSFTIAPNTIYSIRKGYGFFINNIMSELDIENEWFFDKKTNNVYLIAPNNVNPNTLTVEASIYDYGLKILNQSNIQISNLSFTGQKIDGIYTDWCSNIIINNNQLQSIGHNAISSGDKGCDNCQITNNVISNISNNGIQNLIGQNCAIKNNSLSKIALLPGLGGSGDGQYIGIVAGPKTSVAYNQLDSIGYIGIIGNNHDTISFNTINHSCLTKDDGAAIYTYKSNGLYISNNIILNGIGNSEAIPISYETLALGIYLDDSSSFCNILNNTVCNTDYGLFIHNSFDNNIKNNVFYNNRRNQMIVQNDFTVAISTWVKNNIFEGNILYSMTADQIPLTLFTLRNNLESLGSFDNNYYCNPYNNNIIKTINVPDFPNNEIRKTAVFDLNLWQTIFKKDMNSKISFIANSKYFTSSKISGNLITNSTFDSNISDWDSWGSNFHIKHDTLKNKQTALTAYYTNKNTDDVGFSSGNFNVAKGQKYELSFNFISHKISNLSCAISQKAAPYITLSKYFANFVSNNESKNFNYIFEADTTLKGARIIFNNNFADSTIHLDNVELYNVAIDTNQSQPFRTSPIFINTSNVAKTYALNSSYKDLDGKAVVNTVTVAPYSSIILTKGTVTNIERGFRELKNSKSNLYPNPINQAEKITIESENIIKGQKIDLLIFNHLGQVLTNKQIKSMNDGKFEVYTEDLPKSDYIIQIHSNNQSESFHLKIK